MMEDIVLLWALPSLITSLAVIASIKKDGSKQVVDFDLSEWAGVIACSGIYPFGLFIVFCIDVWPWLIKTRNWNNQ